MAAADVAAIKVQQVSQTVNLDEILSNRHAMADSG